MQLYTFFGMIYRIKIERQNGGDAKYYGQFKETSKNVIVQAFYDFVFGWQDIGPKWTDDRQKVCSYAKTTIEDHKNRMLDNEASKVVKIEYINNCEDENEN